MEQTNFIFIILIFLGGYSKQGSSALAKGITAVNWIFIIYMLKVRILSIKMVTQSLMYND